MTLSPNIILGNDYVTAYFADQIWPKTLKDHRKRWDEAAKLGDPTPRSRLGELAKAYFRLKPDAADGDPEALRVLCAQVASALGYPVSWRDETDPQPASVAMVRGDDAYDIPGIAVLPEDDEPPMVLVVEATEFTTDPSLLITPDAKPARLPNRYGDLGKVVAGTDTIPSLVNFVFAMERPPRWVLVIGGGAVALIDHKPWLEGKWLGANVDDILSNNDRTAGGELDQFAGWFSTAGTIPDDDGTSLLDAAVDGSRRQAVGVSESLRDAVRAGVEAIANEVLYDRRERRKLSVFGEQGGVTVDAADLARQSIRWMYRLVVLLYAEARPNIGILPTTAEGTTLYDLYETGYGLERLRQLSLVELETEAARNGTHIHQSLNLLFRLVNEGHHRPTDVELTADGDDPWTGIEFTPLNSRLFGKNSCADIDNAQLRDHVLQKVIAGLCFTPGEKGRGRQAVSYANLEINQLGAVYEGLMAYTGFIALEDRHEVAARKKGDTKTTDGMSRSADPSRGSWTVPVTEYDRYPEDVFVTETDPDTGEVRPIVHAKGSFVFRLAGRDRARSASFYTPSVLTEFTVRHALEEWQDNHPDLTAADVLQMTILEPALGSGAFANEACDQAAELYLRLREADTGETVPVEDRAIELRKLRAHFAINQTYGVDLNDTGVELAEVSLWLNSMHPGLAAPPLSHRLRRGNSLIGCTRSTYTDEQVAKQPWKGDVFSPIDKPLDEYPLGSQGLGIHHFLLPGEGWGAAARTGNGNPCRELAPEWCEAVWDWKKGIHKKPSKAQIMRAKKLANKIEVLWAAAGADVESHLNAQNRRISIWHDPGRKLPLGDSTRFRDPNGPYQRLKTIMDAWCALWIWAPEHGSALPSLDQWLDCIDYLCGERRADAAGRLFGEHTETTEVVVDSEVLFETETGYDDTTTVEMAAGRWRWLTSCRSIAARQGFFHWELDFSPVLATGGFGLQVGNPPWVRQRWNEDEALAEVDPWWGLSTGMSATPAERRRRRSVLLDNETSLRAVVSEAAEHWGTAAALGSASRTALLAGVQTNLYLNFILETARHAARSGVVALIHPDDHLSDPAAGNLRRFLTPRLRRHWQFANELRLFKEIGESKEYSIDIYGGTALKEVSFLQASYLLHPATADGSMNHDGSGPAPGVKHPGGEWDLRPHRTRILTVDSQVLHDWSRLTSGAHTDESSVTRVLRPVTTHDQDALAQIAQAATRLRDTQFEWSRGIDEDKLVRGGLADKAPHRPTEQQQLVLQGPHIENGAYAAQESREVRHSNNDWDAVDMEEIDEWFLPRTGYRPVVDVHVLAAAYGGELDSGLERFREVHREFVAVDSPRTLQAALCPDRVLHINSVNSIALASDALTLRWVGLLSSIPMDAVVKVLGADHINRTVAECLPIPAIDHDLDQELVGRVCWLNCLTRHFERVWNDIGRVQSVSPVLIEEPFPAHRSWSAEIPLRDDFSRWAVLCEIDALVALLFDLSEDNLVQLFRSNFGKLRSYEHMTVFDSEGRNVCGIHHAWTARQQRFEDDLKAQPTRRGQGRLKLWERVEAFREGEPDVDLAYLAPPFRRGDRELAMRIAYRAFAERSGRTDGLSSESLPEWEVWG